MIVFVDHVNATWWTDDREEVIWYKGDRNGSCIV